MGTHRYPLGNMYPSYRWGLGIASVDEHSIAGVTLLVPDVAYKPAMVFGRGFRMGYEDHLEAEASWSMHVFPAPASL